MNTRPFAHLESTWLNQGTPCGGQLCECDLDRACLAKQPVKLERLQVEGMDSEMDWAAPTPMCSACVGGMCAAPLACEQAEQCAPKHGRQRWQIVALAVGLGAAISAACWVGYFRVPT